MSTVVGAVRNALCQHLHPFTSSVKMAEAAVDAVRRFDASTAASGEVDLDPPEYDQFIEVLHRPGWLLVRLSRPDTKAVLAEFQMPAATALEFSRLVANTAVTSLAEMAAEPVAEPIPFPPARSPR